MSEVDGGGVVATAEARVPWVAAFLDERRGARRFGRSNWPGQEVFRDHQARAAATWAKLGERLAGCTAQERRAAVVCLLIADGLDSTDVLRARDAIGVLLPGVGGWSAGEVEVMLRYACGQAHQTELTARLPIALTAAEQLDADGCRAVEPWLRHAHGLLMSTEVDARRRKALVGRVQALLTCADEATIPEGLIPPHDPWAAPLRAQAPTAEFAALLRHFVALSGPRPSQRWRSECIRLVGAASASEVVGEVLGALAEGDPGREEWRPGSSWAYLVRMEHGDLARGLVWAAALQGGAAAVPRLTALALRLGVPRNGMLDSPKLVNATVNALAEVDGPTGLEALGRLQTAIKDRGLRKQIAAALATAARRLGITAAQLVERGVPDHGLAADGSADWVVDGHRVRLAVVDGAVVRTTYTAPDGRTTATAPPAIRDELGPLKAVVKELRKTVAGERARVEGLLATDRSWPYDEWCRYYRDHPVTGAICRALIWEFEDGDGAWTAVAPGADPGGATVRVRLWHPVRASADEVAGWREHMLAAELRQPFKQAFREVYLSTPAEEATGSYSNRFAGHIVHYQQLYALFKARGWQANYLSNHDGGYEGDARAEFGEGQWRARFHHEPAEDGFAFTPDLAATDQIRFERRDGRRWRPVRVAEVPPEVLSEAMRDVDLFVAVTSIAADPTWSDRGEDRHADYWSRAATEHLTASAEVRREVLARLLPRLRLAKQCRLEGRYLVVSGRLATYRIHLGSANVLMEPGGGYLCIVQARSRGVEKVFLPFEDERLSLILSKAAMLAADAKITDPSILAQIRRNG
ncbi:DUF4132 domain-containing protein [Streptacidiphilus carbonis]|uniref:DUF4132 domain-containing protein n=1 Tax=Streptacidiphilus carbonis TaxID=105422 RepID=UPI00069373E6|nr:DUF4132 domain-containing protein [Streptacidiphilus carbonis]